MQNLKEYTRLYPHQTGKIAKESQRLKHIIDDLSSQGSLEAESQQVYDEFMSRIKQLNELSKKVKIGKLREW